MVELNEVFKINKIEMQNDIKHKIR